jgi:maleamate amidohydrolase
MTDETVYRVQGFGKRIGFGRRPALLVVDFLKGFNDPKLFGGGNIGPAIDCTVKLLAAARKFGLPIAFTRHTYAADGSNRGIFNQKIPKLDTLTIDSPSTEIVDVLAPQRGEYVLCKHYPSAFFATDLASWFSMRGVDTVIVSGCTTSGCVRASVVDAMGHGFRPMVVVDCVGDRAQAPHHANLFDMEQKYADLMSCQEVCETFATLGLGSPDSGSLRHAGSQRSARRVTSP